MDAVVGITESEATSALTLTTVKEKLEFYCESLSSRKRIKECL